MSNGNGMSRRNGMSRDYGFPRELSRSMGFIAAFLSKTLRTAILVLIPKTIVRSGASALVSPAVFWLFVHFEMIDIQDHFALVGLGAFVVFY